MGLMRVEVTRKNISSRKTMSVIEDIENPASAFVVLLIAIINYFVLSAGSWSRSIKSTVTVSILNTRLEIWAFSQL